MENYLVVTSKPWNVSAYRCRTPHLPGNWTLITDPSELTLERVLEVDPRYVFFPHWSLKVPGEILSSATCIGFHMTDLPYGRGGSPLQNLILRGFKDTKLSAIQYVPELDAGPVYLKFPFGLGGRAQEVFERFSLLVYDMIETIIRTAPVPQPQIGEVVRFTRRTPEKSVLPDAYALSALYDHIRMLDAETYPRAFLEHGLFRLEFFDAELRGDEITARVSIRQLDKRRE